MNMLLLWSHVTELTYQGHSLGLLCPSDDQIQYKMQLQCKFYHFFFKKTAIFFNADSNFNHSDSPHICLLTVGTTYMQLQQDYSAVSIKKKERKEKKHHIAWNLHDSLSYNTFHQLVVCRRQNKSHPCSKNLYSKISSA